MRHRKDHRKLSRTHSHRKALLRNLVTSLFIHERIETTVAKAKEAADTYGWAEPRTVGSAVASDAFLPFADGLLAAVEAGATAVIQPGGSIRDDEVIAAADEAGLAMIFTGMRHFRH